MKNTIISFILWILVWWMLFYWYDYVNSDNKKTNSQDRIQNSTWRWNFDPANMSVEQLQRMADRQWITIDEMKEKIKSWEWFRGGMWWERNKNWSGSFNQDKWLNQKTAIDTSTWASSYTWSTNSWKTN